VRAVAGRRKSMRSVDESEIGSAKVLPPEVPTGTAGGRTFLWSDLHRCGRGDTGAGELLLGLDITSVSVHWRV
jgi:hypothetical protein